MANVNESAIYKHKYNTKLNFVCNYKWLCEIVLVPL